MPARGGDTSVQFRGAFALWRMRCVRRAPLCFLLLPTIISFPSYQRRYRAKEESVSALCFLLLPTIISFPSYQRTYPGMVPGCYRMCKKDPFQVYGFSLYKVGTCQETDVTYTVTHHRGHIFSHPPGRQNALDESHTVSLSLRVRRRRRRTTTCQRSTMALFTARADGRSATPAPLDFCKARLWQVTDASIDLRDPNMN